MFFLQRGENFFLTKDEFHLSWNFDNSVQVEKPIQIFSFSFPGLLNKWFFSSVSSFFVQKRKMRWCWKFSGFFSRAFVRTSSRWVKYWCVDALLSHTYVSPLSRLLALSHLLRVSQCIHLLSAHSNMFHGPFLFPRYIWPLKMNISFPPAFPIICLSLSLSNTHTHTESLTCYKISTIKSVQIFLLIHFLVAKCLLFFTLSHSNTHTYALSLFLFILSPPLLF